jgi:hypothetical protein
MPQHTVIIPIFAQAPSKPVLGAPCNGCGVCCLLQPCPLGVLLSGYRHGECQALRWQAHTMLYRCGAITSSREVVSQSVPKWMVWCVPVLSALLGRWAQRWVAAGVGCDCDVELGSVRIEA